MNASMTLVDAFKTCGSRIQKLIVFRCQQIRSIRGTTFLATPSSTSTIATPTNTSSSSESCEGNSPRAVSVIPRGTAAFFPKFRVLIGETIVSSRARRKFTNNTTNTLTHINNTLVPNSHPRVLRKRNSANNNHVHILIAEASVHKTEHIPVDARNNVPKQPSASAIDKNDGMRSLLVKLPEPRPPLMSPSKDRL
jgi:hypothetical protein